MRNSKRGQGLILMALAALLVIGGVSGWLLLSEKPEVKLIEKPAAVRASPQVQR